MEKVLIRTKEVILRRDDFAKSTGEVNYFNDFLLDSLGISRDKHDSINEVQISVSKYTTYEE